MRKTQNYIQGKMRKACKNNCGREPEGRESQGKPARDMDGRIKAGKLKGSNLKWAGLHKGETAFKGST